MALQGARMLCTRGDVLSPEGPDRGALNCRTTGFKVWGLRFRV